MRAIRIHGKLESALLDSPELAGLRGQVVDLIVLDHGAHGNGVANLAALDSLAGKGVIDENAVAELRRVSRI